MSKAQDFVDYVRALASARGDVQLAAQIADREGWVQAKEVLSSQSGVPADASERYCAELLARQRRAKIKRV